MHTTHLIFLAVCACLFSTSSNGLSIKPGTKWNDPQIAVCWENPKNEHAQDRRLIRQAAETTWEKESAVTFTGWKACKEDSKGIRVSVARAHPRVLGRGTELDGLERGMILPPLWTLASMSVNMKASVHEFGHALGFGHEHARSDAPDPKRCGGFSRSGVRIIEDDVALTPFDIDSIMVACVASATRSFSLGTATLSAGDIFGLVQTYGSHPDNKLGVDQTGDRFCAALFAKDFDKDGSLDLAVSAPGKDDGAGAVFVYRGDPKRGLRPWTKLRLQGIEDDEWPGLRTFLSQQNTESEQTASDIDPVITTILSAKSGERGHILPAVTGRAQEGMTVLAVDLNEDGVEDRIIGAPFADGAAQGSGMVIVLRGQRSEESAPGFTHWYWFGQSY